MEFDKKDAKKFSDAVSDTVEKFVREKAPSKGHDKVFSTWESQTMESLYNLRDGIINPLYGKGSLTSSEYERLINGEKSKDSKSIMRDFKRAAELLGSAVRYEEDIEEGKAQTGRLTVMKDPVCDGDDYLCNLYAASECDQSHLYACMKYVRDKYAGNDDEFITFGEPIYDNELHRDPESTKSKNPNNDTPVNCLHRSGIIAEKKEGSIKNSGYFKVSKDILEELLKDEETKKGLEDLVEYCRHISPLKTIGYYTKNNFDRRKLKHHYQSD